MARLLTDEDAATIPGLVRMRMPADEGAPATRTTRCIVTSISRKKVIHGGVDPWTSIVEHLVGLLQLGETTAKHDLAFNSLRTNLMFGSMVPRCCWKRVKWSWSISCMLAVDSWRRSREKGDAIDGSREDGFFSFRKDYEFIQFDSRYTAHRP
jgi:hypothetical protein